MHPWPRKEAQENVLGFGKKHEMILPLLTEAARRYLAIPASSATSERAFSAGGNIVTHKKTKFQPQNIEKLLYIQQNYDFVQIKYWKLISEDDKDSDLLSQVSDQANVVESDDVVAI